MKRHTEKMCYLKLSSFIHLLWTWFICFRKVCLLYKLSIGQTFFCIPNIHINSHDVDTCLGWVFIAFITACGAISVTDFRVIDWVLINTGILSWYWWFSLTCREIKTRSSWYDTSWDVKERVFFFDTFFARDEERLFFLAELWN